jgi:hypothetical protein
MLQSPRILIGKPQETRPFARPSRRRHRNTKRDTGSVRCGFRWLRIRSRGNREKSVVKEVYISTPNKPSWFGT